MVCRRAYSGDDDCRDMVDQPHPLIRFDATRHGARPVAFVSIKERLEVNGDRVSDFHISRVGPGHTALVASVVTDELKTLRSTRLLTVELHICPDHEHPHG